MKDKPKNILESTQIEASAPCRIDMGGTLDISTFYYPLRHLHPCTFNIAIGLRTQVRLLPYDKDKIKISSTGFKSAEYPIDEVPFDHPLGLMFAVAAYFRIDGVHIQIESASPPRSALGGSSVAAVALIGAYAKLLTLADSSESPDSSSFPSSGLRTRNVDFRQKTAMLAHVLEASVAGVPCGTQDQLAAAYGGVNAWYWNGNPIAGEDLEGFQNLQGLMPIFEKKSIVEQPYFEELKKHLLLAYCGIPHESKDINRRWVMQFLSGKFRKLWAEIIVCTQKFIDALSASFPSVLPSFPSSSLGTSHGFDPETSLKDAVKMMNRETAIRRKMTPDVLDDMGKKLFESAVENSCGARFTGAGGGGCLWALGEIEDIDNLRGIWNTLLSERKDACLLDVEIDLEGLK